MTSRSLPADDGELLEQMGRAQACADEIAIAVRGKARLACFWLYADEAIHVAEDQCDYGCHDFQRMELRIPSDVRGRFAGLLFVGAEEHTSVCHCRMGEQEAWCVPLSVGMFEALDWAGDAYPSAPIEPGMLVQIDVSGPFRSVQFLVLKSTAPASA